MIAGVRKHTDVLQDRSVIIITINNIIKITINTKLIVKQILQNIILSTYIFITYLLLFTETYELALEVEKRAENISTSDEGQMNMLNRPHTTPEPKKRLIKKPRFHDEIESYKNDGSYPSVVI